MMRGLAWLAGILFIAQSAAAVPQWAFRITFTDKTGSPAIGSPSSFLSARALARRTQQGVTVMEADRPVSAIYTDSVLRLTSGKLHCTSRWFNRCVVLLTDSSKILELQNKSFISQVERIGYFSGGLHKGATGEIPGTTAVPPTGNKGTGSSAYYGATWGQTSMVNGDYLHDNGLMGQGQLIAVLDLGFIGSDTHDGFDSLRARNGIADQFNFVNANTNVYSRSAHGTASLSTMAGLIPGSYVGTAPRASYALYIVDDVDYTDALYELDNVIAAIERADSVGADIITASVGYNEFTNPVYSLLLKSTLNGHTTHVAIAANMAVARGIFFSVSAGNEGGNTWDFLLTPGDADSALTVGSINSARTVSGFSSPGPNTGGRIKPDVCLQGEPVAIFTSANTVGSNSGTSFATPQLSGWAACIRQFKPSISPAALREAIVRSADRYTAPLPKYGYGIPDFKKVLESLDVAVVPGKALLNVSPNPFKDRISIRVSLAKNTEVQCVITDITGREITAKTFSGTAGNQQLMIELPASLPSGTYMLRTAIGGETFSNKLTKL